MDVANHPIRRLARLLREAEAACAEQASEYQDSWHPVRMQAEKAASCVGRARIHAGACLGLLLIADDIDAFRGGPEEEMRRLRVIIEGMAVRIAAQSELLGARAEK